MIDGMDNQSGELKKSCFWDDSPWMLKLRERSGLSSYLNSRLLRSGLFSPIFLKDLLTFKEDSLMLKKLLLCGLTGPESLRYRLIFYST